MFALVTLLAASEGGQVQEIARSFGVDWIHLAAQAISFGIVCALLYRFAYRPILTMLEQRRQQIADGIANSEKIKAELAQTTAQRQQVLKEAGGQATKLVQEAHVAAARVQKVEMQKAITSAEEIIAKARQAATLDHDRMLAELKREIGHLVVQTTAAVTGKILTPDDHQRLVEETAKHVA